LTRRILFFGGNGHCAARLEAARAAASRLDITIDEVPYPGFEGRPRAASLDAFLDAIARPESSADVVYATGIGGLLALALRARGDLLDRRLLLQAPVLWGLEHRFMPRLMRIGAVRHLAAAVFTSAPFQSAFARRYFTRELSAAERAAFFDGYARCTALTDLFAWLTPQWLRRLEVRFANDRAALDGIDVWWGGRDGVVTVEELRKTEKALNVRWPLRIFPDWGHYPMIDTPEAWAAAVAEFMST
jgi:pimeloyl-ACP methyl ester carboxylesterase